MLLLLSLAVLSVLGWLRCLSLSLIGFQPKSVVRFSWLYVIFKPTHWFLPLKQVYIIYRYLRLTHMREKNTWEEMYFYFYFYFLKKEEHSADNLRCST